MRRGQGRTKDQAGPSSTSSLTSKRYKSGRKYGHLYGDIEGALEEAGRAEQHIITEAASNELKSGEGA